MTELATLPTNPTTKPNSKLTFLYKTSPSVTDFLPFLNADSDR